MDLTKYGFRVEARAPKAENRIPKPYESKMLVDRMLKSLNHYVKDLKIKDIDTVNRYCNYEVTWSFSCKAKQYVISFSCDSVDAEKCWCSISDMSNPEDDTACADVIWDGREIKPVEHDVASLIVVLNSHLT